MLTIYVITPFPDILNAIFGQSMLKKAVDREKVKYVVINLFDFVNKDDGGIDDYPFGVSKGMIMKAGPVLRAFNSINIKKARVVFPTPDGQLFTQKIATDLSNESSLVFVCGHYKGIDQRIRDSIVTDELSIGDYVLTNGELPSLVMIDSIVRLIPGVLNHYESAETDSFFDDLLDGPHYTRPRDYEGLKVPNVLLSGHHQKIKDWFLDKRIEKTKKRRKDLFEKYKSKNNGEKNE
ncbi:MAG: tRNA (guanosine(37)-N1)-methyltransferase TrmD [Candidatus Marinimicrobia bacterium]|nr:tRNA (guanosine(37)-N1)-methyltransferase TrmD [Candidatus Neomarinimicrobiota bacterium]|tara:strand:- start:25649 stop:26356 length:708 start_codon:yes stop_codon:yes gene_type:complete